MKGTAYLEDLVIDGMIILNIKDVGYENTNCICLLQDGGLLAERCEDLVSAKCTKLFVQNLHKLSVQQFEDVVNFL